MGAEQSGDAEHKQSDYSSSGEWDCQYRLILISYFSIFIQELIVTSAVLCYRDYRQDKCRYSPNVVGEVLTSSLREE